jgi:tRNA pseudouridine(55) synthase
MENTYIILKKMGETPLGALERFRVEKKIDSKIPMTYAGRLDPLVEGLMIVLVGDECKNKDEYTKLDKTYEFEILSGVSTDTYDLLGLVTNTKTNVKIKVEAIDNYLSKNEGLVVQKYPPYSSKTFEGKQLHQHAKEGFNPIIEHEVNLFDYKFLGERFINGEELLHTVLDRIDLVNGDFRQYDIKTKWREVLRKREKEEFQITRWSVDVSSGFYIRQLVNDIGNFLNVPTTTFYIKRTKIGDFK